ncbi:hypothetical protein GCM10009828_066010 [Actinoplanes couchii]|uniref:Uncharacterized protein n=1 Tax=Actinoplanes couchii TaxID=403638 RepID=A0ABQ3X2T0_9ACTN|nr:hypothetical protein Aco03nite_011820 [Actinoplanes couchii]
MKPLSHVRPPLHDGGPLRQPRLTGEVRGGKVEAHDVLSKDLPEPTAGEQTQNPVRDPFTLQSHAPTKIPGSRKSRIQKPPPDPPLPKPRIHQPDNRGPVAPRPNSSRRDNLIPVPHDKGPPVIPKPPATHKPGLSSQRKPTISRKTPPNQSNNRVFRRRGPGLDSRKARGGHAATLGRPLRAGERLSPHVRTKGFRAGMVHGGIKPDRPE